MLEHLILMNVCIVEAGVTVLVLSVVTQKSESQESALALRPACCSWIVYGFPAENTFQKLG